MLAQLVPFDLEITPQPRRHCMKCGAKLTHPASGERCWCDTCRYLLRRPETPHPRYNVVEPPREVLDRLGLYLTFDQKQEQELIPSGRKVEQWYDPEIGEGMTPLDMLLRAALKHPFETSRAA